MQVIANVETQNDYVAALTVEQEDATSLLLVVANKSIKARLRPPRRESGGDESYGAELPFTPQTIPIAGVSGAQFRSAEAGQPARIIAVLVAPEEPQLTAGVPFLSQLAASGQIVPDAMTPYIPIWSSAANPQPSLGNAVLTGRFLEIGALVVAEIELVMGSTTTYGTGIWNFTLPIAGLPTPQPWGLGAAADVSAGVTFLTNWRADGFVRSNANPVAAVEAITPFIWAAGDVLDLALVYGKA